MKLRRIPLLSLLLAGALALAGCAPGGMSLQQAEELCAKRARLSDGVGGQVRAGVGSGGVRGGLKLTLTDDILDPKDPLVVYDNCVFQRTGQGPSRPLGMVTG